ncbi:hypothetical protein HanPSC8_Chr08g0315031 [Helianthus annuus]|nr:hypothetical protein HanPSC8_Chr08g0315031 [Helianthus annuus]
MNLSIYVLSWSSSSQMLLVWWMGGTILLFLLSVKSLKAPEKHISLVMPNSSSIGAMGRVPKLDKKIIKKRVKEFKRPQSYWKICVKVLFSFLIYMIMSSMHLQCYLRVDHMADILCFVPYG